MQFISNLLLKINKTKKFLCIKIDLKGEKPKIQNRELICND